MKCARLHLHERAKARAESGGRAPERPRRFCQRRLVDPRGDADPRWAGLLDRFHCNGDENTLDNLDSSQANNTHDDLFLSVQNLKFDGNVAVRRRPKTCFKYKALNDGKKHRMFVKQIVEEEESNAEECSSQLTCYYFDDYVKYIFNNDLPDPVSEKSSLLFISRNNKEKENKLLQLENKTEGSDIRKCENYNAPKIKFASSKELKENSVEEPSDLTSENTKIAYHQSGKRKCLTISRAQSPETVQVIRVDVVCHYSTSSTVSDLGAGRKHHDNTFGDNATNTFNSKIINNINMKTSHFSNKYLLTNTTKPLDENVSGGAKVTLLCKTFRLSRRTTSKLTNRKADIKNK